MTSKDNKKGIIPSIVGKFNSFSSKEQEEVGQDLNNNGDKDKSSKNKSRPTSIQLSSNSKTYERIHRSLKRNSAEVLKDAKKEERYNSSEWVESMEHIKDKGKIKKKKKKKKKHALNGNVEDSPFTQPVRLNHAPSIAGILNSRLNILIILFEGIIYSHTARISTSKGTGNI